MHALCQIAGGNGLQHLGQRTEVAIGSGHQLVKAFHHRQKIMLKPLRVAAYAEVAIGGRLREQLDLAVHRREVALDRIHGVAEHGLLAGQAVHVLAHVADGIARHDLRQFHLDFDMRSDQCIGIAHHAAVFAGKRRLIHAEADLAGVVPARHVLLRGCHRLELILHAAHAGQQLARFVARLRADRVIQLAVRDGLGHLRGLLERTHQAARNQPRQRGGQAGREQAEGDQCTVCQRNAAQNGVGTGGILLVLQFHRGGNRLGATLKQWLRLAAEQPLCTLQVASAHQVEQAAVGGACSGEAVFDGLPCAHAVAVGW